MKACLRKWGVICLLLLSVASPAGNEVGGGGIAENNILYAWLNLDTFIDLCLHSSQCSLNERETKLLQKIRASLVEERKTKELIRFKSGKEHEQFFFVDGHLRVARTGYHVGDLIYINLDLIYPQATVTSIPLLPPPDRPLDIPLAVGVLVHELGHHQGERDHTFLDTLGAKVNSAMRMYGQELDGGPFERELIVTSFEFPGKRGELIARDSTEIRRFGKEVLQAFTCPNASAKAFALWNLHWMKEKFIDDKNSIRHLRARAVVTCEGGGAEALVNRELDGWLWVKKENGKLELIPDRTKFRQTK